MKSRIIASLTSLFLATALVTAQTVITPPSNKYTPAQDVELGRDAAAQARQQLPILRDESISSYVNNVGQRLVAAIPAEFRHPEFRYTFEVVNVREINAFALPGGPMFVNRGMIEAAKNEAEMAGVMAHELSHVVLRHGTAQASRATKYEVGALAGAVLGAIIGGNVGNVVAQGAQFGIGTAFMRFGREYERQADIEGSHIMARAGYDPRAMASMFQTIEKQGGSGGPEWMSDHPNPGNRSAYITKEASLLHVDNPIRDTRGFDEVRAELRGMPRAPTTEEATRNTRGTSGSNRGGDIPRGTRIEPPSSRYTQYNEGDLFRVSVPSNWRELQNNNTVTFAPDGAYGQGIFSHGVEFGIERNETHDLQTATDELIDSLARSNPRMSQPSGYRRASIDGRRGLETTIQNVSDSTGQRETIQIATTQLRDGNLFYVIAVAPEAEIRDYQPVFRRVVGSINLND